MPEVIRRRFASDGSVTFIQYSDGSFKQYDSSGEIVAEQDSNGRGARYAYGDGHRTEVETWDGEGRYRSYSIGDGHRTLIESAGPPDENGCYISTACMEAMGLPDNCHELLVLRKFRDQHLLRTNAGKGLVKVYYDIAPIIVSRIQRDSGAHGTWQAIFTEIQKAIVLIQQGRFNEAIRCYTRVTLSLRTEYLHK